MEVDCEGCAGCCIDWDGDRSRPASGERTGTAEHGGRYEPLDDATNLVVLARAEVRAFVDAGLGDALQPRLFAPAPEASREDGEVVALEGVDVAAIDGRPVFVVGLRKPPKPVAPFGEDAAWLPTCIFLDPQTLQCRIHGEELYPDTCGTYPGQNLRMGAETECERVEAAHGGERLLDGEPPPDAEPQFGPGALGSTVFAHPAPGRRPGIASRLQDGATTAADRAEYVAVAAAASPGTLAVSGDHYERARERVAAADSWAGAAIRDWRTRHEDWRANGGDGSENAEDGDAPDPATGETVEDDRGAPPTPGWDGN